MFKNTTASKKSDHTRERIYKVAAGMIARKGFDATTMRGIAAEAGVAVAATYYYFDTKEALVQEYYRQSHADHVKALEGVLEKKNRFGRRLQLVVTRKIEVAEPFKNMARALYRVAANPESPLSPFSPESKALRLEALDVFREVVEGSREKFDPELREVLPEFLWLYQMGIILFWIYDESKGSSKTFALIDKTVPLIGSISGMIQSPLARPLRKKIISALRDFLPDLGQGRGSKHETH